jgi:Family of unknown function (DUF6247)
MSVAARVEGDHFELPADAAELLRQVRPADQQWCIEEVTQALAVAADTKDSGPLQEVLEAWTATVRLQQQPGAGGGRIRTSHGPDADHGWHMGHHDP